MSSRLHLWSVGRAPVAALACGLGACALPLLVAVWLWLVGGGVGIFGVFVFSVFLMVIGLAFGSVVVHAIATVLFGVAALESTSTLGSVQRPLLMIIAGAVLFASFALAELSSTVRRSPRVEKLVWRQSALVTGAIMAVAAVLAGIAYVVATRSVLPAVVLPVGLLGVGAIIKLSTDRLT